MNKTVNRKIETVKELICWSYANLAMAHAALQDDLQSYNKVSFMIRSRLYKGLLDGTMNIGTMFEDEKLKIRNSDKCAYCGAYDDISIDHMIPRYMGGNDSANNLIRACKRCNSSKGKKDMMEWYNSNNLFPPILLLRRYLKLIYTYCSDANLLDFRIDAIDKTSLPFSLDYIPIDYPQPKELILYK